MWITMKTLFSSSSCCLLLAAACSTCVADTTPANLVEVGMYYIHFDVDASDVSGPYVPPGLNLDVKDIETPYLSYERRVWDHFDLALSMGYPPVAHAEGKGPEFLGPLPYSDQVLLTTRALAPTLLAKYVFLDDSGSWHPYLGVGVNYTNFYDRNATSAGTSVLGGPTSISLSSSVGPAATIGLRYSLQTRWSLEASYTASKVNTRLTADTEGFLRTSHIELNPGALVVAAGYSF
jgi:outer membrane protein